MATSSVLLILTAGICAVFAQLPTIVQPEVAGAPSWGSIPDFRSGATVLSTSSGSWSASSTWSTNQVPGTDAIVLIQPGHQIQYDVGPGGPFLERVAIDGVLDFSRTINTEMRVGTVFVYKGGSLIIGTEEEPISESVKAYIKFRGDRDIDTVADPNQFSLGLLVLGEASMHGRRMTPYTRLAEEVSSSSDTLQVHDGQLLLWSPGDKVLIPDTRQLADKNAFDTLAMGYTEEAVVSSVGATSVTLEIPTQYAHLGVRNADGQWDVDSQGRKEFIPHVANLERNIILESEYDGNDARRSHIMVTSQGKATLRFVKIKGMGRTKADMAPGPNNIIGRYALHFHHAIGKPNAGNTGYQQEVWGCLIEDSLKWGLAIHNTHFSYFGYNIIYKAGGSGIMTEDGNEYGNSIVGNYIYGVWGTGDDALGATYEFGPATEGSGIWLHGIYNSVTDNVASNIYSGGSPSPRNGQLLGIFSFGYTVFAKHTWGGGPVSVPTTRGSYENWTNLPGYSNGLIFHRNEAYGPMFGGATFWSIGRYGFDFPNSDETIIDQVKCWNFWTFGVGIFAYQTNNVTFSRLKVRGNYVAGTRGWFASDYVSTATSFVDLDIQGMALCLELPDLRAESDCPRSTPYCRPAVGDAQTVVKGGIFKCPVIFKASRNWNKNGGGNQPSVGPSRVVIDNATLAIQFSANCYQCNPKQVIRLASDCRDATNLLAQDEIIFLNYNGTPGDDFQVFWREQSPQYVFTTLNHTCCQSTPDSCGRPCVSSPIVGISNQDLWNQQSLAYAGGLTPCTDTRAHIYGTVRLDNGVYYESEPAYTCPVSATNVFSYQGSGPIASSSSSSSFTNAGTGSGTNSGAETNTGTGTETNTGTNTDDAESSSTTIFGLWCSILSIAFYLLQ